jgi:DNA-binding Lrp family transcriptional regulator
MIQMAIGYVLINVSPGKELEVYQIASNIDAVKDATLLFGDYDIILKLESESLGDIAGVVVEKIRQIEGVTETKTLAGADI